MGLLIVLAPGSGGVPVTCLSRGRRCCPVCPGRYRLQPRRNGSPSVPQGQLVLASWVQGGRRAAASRRNARTRALSLLNRPSRPRRPRTRQVHHRSPAISNETAKMPVHGRAEWASALIHG
jgi:hypothetical protein